MRKFLIALACVVVLLVGGGALVMSPWFMEKSIEWTCGKPSPRCFVRLRPMGHVWSLKDNLPRAQIWYERAALGGDVPAMFQLGWFYEQDGCAGILPPPSSATIRRRSTSPWPIAREKR